MMKNLFMCLRFTSKKPKQNILSDDYDDDENSKKDMDMDVVRKFSWKEIESSTSNFSKDKVIGSGGFSTVFLAAADSDINISQSNLAVKIQSGTRVFKQELDILLHLHHHNIVKLVGYSDDIDREEGALVFEYVSNGNLQEKLHGDDDDYVLPWKNRMAIAFQVAEAIEYLHEKCALQIVHGDIKASNILLDENLNCKLCDFGFAKMGFSSMVTTGNNNINNNNNNRRRVMMMGSPGYTDPHYIRTGIASKKNDVYSYGVLLLELVTGKEAFCSTSGQMLVSVVGPTLIDVRDFEHRKVAEMVDPRLAGDFDVEEAKTMLSISAMCLNETAALRPGANQILNTINSKISSISFLFSSLPHHKC
ncbi:probable receptor-like protein kinase At1g33260 [Ziziphus jujuba]|uniref:Probable receptor-like protein kinase At1g33260 n=1 Tax=Ziziphus jujuba TaxID=326968 RepID=A0A6P4A1S0_ZIZJJ|nr:probable receptor-like protein kinase At1g33260 [Ziziphus jujuba]